MGEACTDDEILTEHRSYDADEVDAFLERVRMGVARLEKGKQAAVERMEAAERTVEERELEWTAHLGRGVLGTQEALDRALAGARQEADDIVAGARARADQILASAEASAYQTTTTADDSGDNLFADLRRTIARGGALDSGADHSNGTDAPGTHRRCQLCDDQLPDSNGHFGLCMSCGGSPDESPVDPRTLPVSAHRSAPPRRLPAGANRLASYFTRRH